MSGTKVTFKDFISERLDQIKTARGKKDEFQDQLNEVKDKLSKLEDQRNELRKSMPRDY